MRNGFEYYQQLLVDMVEHPGVVTEDDVADVESSSEEKRGELAFSLLAELEIYWEALNFSKRNKLADKLFMHLITSLAESTSFTYENFAYIASHGSLFVLTFTLFNKRYPVSLLVDYVYSQDDGSSSKDLTILGYSSFEDMLAVIRGDRLEEVVVFLRERELGLESLSDEMVLSVAGVTFSRS